MRFGWQVGTAYQKPHHYTVHRNIVLEVLFPLQAFVIFGRPGGSGWDAELLHGSWAERRTSIQIDMMPEVLLNFSLLGPDKY